MEAELAGELHQVSLDRAEALFAPADKVHLVDREHDAFHADEIENRRVAARLRFQACARVDQHHGDVGVAGAGGHIARVLLVAGRVDDHDRRRPAST